MPIKFLGSEDVSFHFLPRFPVRSTHMNVGVLLRMYGLYRDAVFKSYAPKIDLAKDIVDFPYQFDSDRVTNRTYHYAVAACLDAMNEWRKPDNHMRAYVAVKNNVPVGFIHFRPKQIDGREIVYIEQAGVSHSGQGIGSQLMQCVLAHFPAGTEFQILTRRFNTEAITLYQTRFGFDSITPEGVRALGLDDRYVGFQHITTPALVSEIQRKMGLTFHQLSLNSISDKDQRVGTAMRLYVLYRWALWTSRRNRPVDSDVEEFSKHGAVGLLPYVITIAQSAITGMRDPKTRVLVLNRHGKTEGFVSFYEEIADQNPLVYIDHIAVTDRHSGFGKKLMDHLKAMYPAGTEFTLCVRKSNEVAFASYLRSGFRVDDTLPKRFGYNPAFFIGMTTRIDKEKGPFFDYASWAL